MSERHAKTSEDNAAVSETNANASASSASLSSGVAEEAKRTAEAWAVGKRDGVDVGNGDQTYHNNAKYWSNTAANSATLASNSAGGASTSEQNAEAWAVGKRNGNPVESGDVTYHNNAQYFASQSEESAGASSRSAEASASEALKSEGFSSGKQNGTDVESGSAYYHNNAAYFADQASGSAQIAHNESELASNYKQDAVNAKTASETARDNAQAWAEGKRGNAAVTSGEAQYNNYSKYWAEQAAASATSASAMTGLAKQFQSNVSYDKGEYVIQNGVLYRFDNPHEAGTWTGTDATAVLMGDNVAVLEEEMPNKANIYGSYDSMTVGNAKQLVATVGIEDNVPYLFRTSGGSIDIGNREDNKLIGGTIAWNQLFDFIEGSAKWLTNGAVTQTWNDGAVTISNGNTASAYLFQNYNHVSGHKYLYSFAASCTRGDGVSTYAQVIIYFGSTASGTTKNINISETKSQYSGVITSNETGDFKRITLRPNHVDNTLTVANFIFFDLTLMFGSTIADYIYSLEQSTPGAGVAWFRKLFPKNYYAYDSGSVQSVNVSSHNMTGLNQWDEEWETGMIDTNTGVNTNSTNRIRSKNYISCFPNTAYCISCQDQTIGKSIPVFIYDANKKYIGFSNRISGTSFITNTNTYYMRFFMQSDYGAVYKNDICINLSWDGERDGEYEPYEKHSYPLDSSVTLRGMPKLDANTSLYYDGDTYESDGTVTRKYGVVDLGTINWEYMSDYAYPYFASQTQLALAKKEPNVCSLKCGKYLAIPNTAAAVIRTNDGYNKTICLNIGTTYNFILIQDAGYTDPAAFKASLDGVMLVYELATPTTETADGFSNPQVVNDFGTEEYVDYGVSQGTRDVAIPVGHETTYQANLRAKLEMAPESPDGDGDYIVRQTDGENAYVPLLTDATLTLAGKPADAKAVGELKASVDGYYPDMTVGNAEQLVATVGIEDKVPYTFRTSGGTADIGDREVDMLVGGTVAWNQQIKGGDFADDSHWKSPSSSATFSVSNGVATITMAGNYGRLTTKGYNLTAVPGHKYLFTAQAKKNKSLNGNVFTFNFGGVVSPSALRFPTNSVDEWKTYSAVCTPTTDTVPYFYIGDCGNNYEEGYVIDMRNVMVIDLTQMFGSTIADYIYSLETATPGTGIAWFKKLFPKDYYAYDAGSLQSVQAASHEMTGFNQWDEEWEEGGYASTTGAKANYSNSIRCKNLIPVVPNNIYYVKNDASTWYTNFYDANGVWIRYDSMHSGNTTVSIPDGVYFITFWNYGYGTTYHNNICINLSWDGERDGEYEPYEKHSYPLDSLLTLRGIPKLDANNGLYYDGDTYESDGTVTRKFFEYTVTGSEAWAVAVNGYIKSDACDAYITFADYFSGMVSGKTKELSMVNRLLSPGNTSIWTTEGYTNEYVLNAMQLHLNIANGLLGITDPSQETTSSARDKIKTYLQSLYNAGTPLKFILPITVQTVTEEAEPYQNPQIVDDFGTEEYVTTSIVPVGHETQYQANLRAKLEMAPDSPDGDGDYIVRQSGGENTYVPLVIPEELPSKPTANGTYVLKVTVNGGTSTLAWVAE